MTELTKGTVVVVKERHNLFAYEEGVLLGTEPDASVQIEADALGRVAQTGERYEWNDRNNSSHVPFTVVRRFSSRHKLAGFFAILSDDASADERHRGHSAIASAAELAHYADLLPDQAPPRLSLAERMRRWVDDGMPRPWPNAENHPVREFADEAQALQDRADALAEATARLLTASADDPSKARDLAAAALDAYRATVAP